MSIYTASAIGLVVTMIWGEVLFYLDGKVIPRIEGYFRRRRAATVDRESQKSQGAMEMDKKAS